MRMRDAYRHHLDSGAARPDAAQAAVAEKLAILGDGLETLARPPAGGWLGRLLGRPAAAAASRGLYIHGEVGRGKTMLMDLFFASVEGLPKMRVHFHAFMQDVHARLHKARQSQVQDAIAPVARAIAGDARLLCLDEMQITDIADAMIVGRLFEQLVAQGTVVVTTSNLPPSELYRNGLNRQLFLPFIRLIETGLDVVSLDGDIDYRLGRVKAHESFITPLGPEADARIEELWKRLTDSAHGSPCEIDVLGRKLLVPEAAHGCARFSFADLCEAPLGPADYLALARHFRTVFVEHIPALKALQRNEARRFITLIDTLYDARVRLVASSAKGPEGIYPGGDHGFEFGRTVSRLKEMQSAAWWGKKIAET